MTTITVHLVESNGTRHTLAAPVAQSLMRAAVAAGLDGIKADCGAHEALRDRGRERVARSARLDEVDGDRRHGSSARFRSG